MPLLTSQPKPATLASAPSNPQALAAALQLGQLTGLQLPRPAAHEQAESPSNAKAEVRKARRWVVYNCSCTILT